MASLREYIEEQYSELIYAAGENYFISHPKAFKVETKQKKIVIKDRKIKKVYANINESQKIVFDVLLYICFSLKNNNLEKNKERHCWLIISCEGVLEAGIKKFTICAVKPYDSSLNNVCAHMFSDQLVPYFYKKELDKKAEEFLQKYYPSVLEKPRALNPYKLLLIMGLSYKEQKLTDNGSIMGQIYFQDDPDQKISAGTVLIDEQLENMRNEGVVNQTIIHECVHWEFHRYAFELEKAYHNGIVKLSTSETIVQNEELAIDWIEWQAQTLAPKILMPQKMFELKAKLIQEDLMDRWNTKDELVIIEEMIDELARFFGVSRLSVKVRLIEVGVEIAQGAFIFIDGRYVPAHRWEKNYLMNRQTFSISAAELDLNKSKYPTLDEWINQGVLVFVESHLCLNDSKYVAYDQKWGARLTSYARNHMDECCMVFDISIENSNKKTIPSLNLLLNRDSDSNARFNYEYSKDQNERVIESITACLKEVREIGQLPNDFGKALKKLMKCKKITNEELAERIQMSPETISKYRNNKMKPTLGAVIALCVGLDLPLCFSECLVALSGKTLRSNKDEEVCYQYFLAYSRQWTVPLCNETLVKNGFKALGRSER